MKPKLDPHTEELTRRYRKIGVAAVAAAVPFQGERKNTNKNTNKTRAAPASGASTPAGAGPAGSHFRFPSPGEE